MPALDVGEQCHSRLGLALEAVAIDQLSFGACEEALDHGIILSIACGAHRMPHTHRVATLPKLDVVYLAYPTGRRNNGLLNGF